MTATPSAPSVGDYYLIDAVSYEPAADLLKFRFRNGDLTEIRGAALGHTAPQPDWSLARIEPDHVAILVPTGENGETLRIESEAIRATSCAEPCADVQEVSAADGGVQGCE